jgi:hypothetical protein
MEQDFEQRTQRISRRLTSVRVFTDHLEHGKCKARGISIVAPVQPGLAGVLRPGPAPRHRSHQCTDPRPRVIKLTGIPEPNIEN